MKQTLNKSIRYSFMLLGIALALSIAGWAVWGIRSVTRPAVAAVAAQAAPAPVTYLSTAISRVAKAAIPAVVHIEVTQRSEITNPFVPFENNPFFHYFFNAPQNMPRKFKRELKGLGSGMIMDSRGYILTNNHVVGGASEIEMLLADGSRYPADLVGTDPKTDLAVIRIKTDDKLPHVTFGDSDEMSVGDWVVTIGHPRGLDQTVTQGIVSAKHRRGIMNPSSYQDYIQTDAAINPGNSGGPLLNLDGKVIGVNAAIASESGGFEGIGFAIPSNMAVHIAEELIQNGKVVRGWLGVSIKDLTPDAAKEMKLDISKGALIGDIVPGSPADDAGLKKDDVVTAFDGTPVEDAATLQNNVANSAIGKQVALALVRDGKAMTVEATIGDMQDAVKKMAESVKDRLGVVVRPVTDEEAEKYGLNEPRGVAVQSLVFHGVLAQLGFEKDDLILMINDQPVSDVQTFVNIVEALKPHQQIQLLALDHRSGQTGRVQATLN